MPQERSARREIGTGGGVQPIAGSPTASEQTAVAANCTDPLGRVVKVPLICRRLDADVDRVGVRASKAVARDQEHMHLPDLIA